LFYAVLPLLQKPSRLMWYEIVISDFERERMMRGGRQPLSVI
jgi:hypothetical protein